MNRRVLQAFAAATLMATTAGAQQSTTVLDSGEARRDVQPMISEVTVSASTVTDVHLQPLFTTTIRLPDAVSSVAIGAPTLFSAEHSDQEPKLVYVKPSTPKASESNLVITMENGETISLRLLSDGASATHAPVDFIVDYKPQASFFIGSADGPPARPKPDQQKKSDPLDQALDGQSRVATPSWQTGVADVKKGTPVKEPQSIEGALGEIRDLHGSMLVAYSVRNQSAHWVEVLPPQIEMTSPGARDQLKKKAKKQVVMAEQVPVAGFRVNGRRLAPGQRLDGVVAFSRPGFKQSQERLLLQLASANSVDEPLLLTVPFVAPGN